MSYNENESFYTPEFIDDPSYEKLPRWGFRDCLVIAVSDRDYQACEKYSHNCWSNHKKGLHGRGEGNFSSDPRRTERTGKLGEMAFAKVFGLPVDVAYRQNGDNCDFEVDLGTKKVTIDVKCSFKPRDINWVDQTDQAGRPVEIKNDIYVFGYMTSDDRRNKTAEVVIMGYMFNGEVKKCEIKRSPIRGRTHYNYNIPLSTTRPIRELHEVFERHAPANSFW